MAGSLPFESQSQQEGRARSILHQHIYKTYEKQTYPQAWRNLPEIPCKEEICPISKSLTDIADAATYDRNFDDYQKDPTYDQDLPHNIVDGPWPSREEYLGAHYQILREDAIAPLRRAVAEFKKCSSLVDDQEVCIYKDVSIPIIVTNSFLTTTGDNQGTGLEQDWCWLPSRILPHETNQVEAVEAIAARYHGSPEQGPVQDRLQDRHRHRSGHEFSPTKPAGHRIILG